MDLYSRCIYSGIKQLNVVFKRFFAYFTPKPDAVRLLEQYGADYVPPEQKPVLAGPKRMNLLIPGAGSQGLVLKEIAEAIGIFHEIAFLDDDVKNPWGIGSLSDYTKLVEQYPVAMPSFGDSYRREKWVDLLEGAGYIVTTLIHPSASVSPSAVIDSVVETMATAQPFVHVDSAVTVGRNAVISPYTRVPRGTIISA